MKTPPSDPDTSPDIFVAAGGIKGTAESKVTSAPDAPTSSNVREAEDEEEEEYGNDEDEEEEELLLLWE